jgi:hypothetical protein
METLAALKRRSLFSQQRRAARRIRHPTKGNIVEDIVSRQPSGVSIKDARNEFVAAYIVIENAGRQPGRRTHNSVERLGTRVAIAMTLPKCFARAPSSARRPVARSPKDRTGPPRRAAVPFRSRAARSRGSLRAVARTFAQNALSAGSYEPRSRSDSFGRRPAARGKCKR